MADIDYGYEDVSGYGYGETEPDMDYGYGNDEPRPDYGYGDDNNEDLGYGYGDAEPESKPVVEEPVEKHRPKRRCSVTKFNLDNDNGTLTAADRIREFRSNETPTSSDDGYKSSDTMDDNMNTNNTKKSSSSKKGLLGRLRK